MFAVIKTGGKQYRVQQGDVLEVEKLDIEAGKKVTFDKVLLVENNGEILIGTPYVIKAQVKAVVLERFKNQKVIVFKKKRRKQYKKKTGHRQQLTRVKIEEILAGGKTAPMVKPEVKAKPKAKKEIPAKPKVKDKAKDKIKVETATKPKSEVPTKKKAETKTSTKSKKKTLTKE
jgi:large subunit ribosomal protein L21